MEDEGVKVDKRVRRVEKLRVRARVFGSKVDAMNERRHALSYTTVFYFLALHKLEHNIISACPIAVRQGLFLLFAHHIVAYGCGIKQLLGFRQSCDLKKRHEPQWKCTLEWMTNSAKAISKVLELPSDDRFTQRVIRGLEEFTDLRLFPEETVRRSSRHSSPRRSPRPPLTAAELQENTVLNPMFAKRLLLNYADNFKECLNTVLALGTLLRPTDPASAARQEEGWAVSMTMEKILQVQSRAAERDMVMANNAVKDLAERIKHLPTLTQDLIRNAQPVTLPNLNIDKTTAISPIALASAAKKKPALGADVTPTPPLTDRPQPKRSDEEHSLLARPAGARFVHLEPPIVSRNSEPNPKDVELTTEERASGDSSGSSGADGEIDLDLIGEKQTLINHPSRSHSHPGVITSREMISVGAHSDDDDDEDIDDDVFSIEDAMKLVSGADLGGIKTPQVAKWSEASEDESGEEEEEPAQLSQTAPPSFEDSKTTQLGKSDVCEVVNFHVILLWSVLYRLLLEGIWDSGIEKVAKDAAESLDVKRQFFGMLLAYAADAVCDTVHNSGSAEDTLIQDGLDDPSQNLSTVKAQELKKMARKNNAIMKGLKIAGMSVGVGALSALTAGLAAPAFAAGFGALGIAGTSGLAAFLGSAGGAASLASVFGASSASLSGWKYSRRLADIRVCEFVKLDSDSSNHAMDAIGGYIHEMIEYVQLSGGKKRCEDTGRTARRKLVTMTSLSTFNEAFPQHSPVNRPLGLHHLTTEYKSSSRREPPFHLAIGVSGWLKDADDATQAWSCLRDCLGTESYAFKWEPQLLTELGFMMMRLVGETITYQAATLSIQIAMSASAGFIMWPVSFVQYAAQLDNAWLTAKERAQQAGIILAAAICDQNLVGNRPVTLIGSSMGSRVITYCLKELHNREQFFRVSDVVLMGLPDGKSREDWKKMRAVVSRRLINVYNSNDLILMFLYRWMEWGVSVAGLSAVEGIAGVENFDASQLIASHYEYEEKLPDILSVLGIHSSLIKYIGPRPPAAD